MKELKKYPPKLFHSTQVKDAFKIATYTKFANLILTNHSQMDVIFNPFFNLFQQTEKSQFYGHMARVNPVYDILSNNKIQKCKLIFNACDVYISPTCYRQKQMTHNVVPTWNYVAAQFTGNISIVPKQQLYELLRKQVQIFESQVGSEWRLTDSTPEYVDSLINKIFGVKVQVTSWKNHMKLSQNKPDYEVENIKKWSEKTQSKRKKIVDWMNQFK